MKSSTSQRAGSSRTFLKTMYFTSGAKVITSRLRTRASPVRLYWLHSASASSAETRRRPGEEGDRMTQPVSGLDPICLSTGSGGRRDRSSWAGRRRVRSWIERELSTRDYCQGVTMGRSKLLFLVAALVVAVGVLLKRDKIAGLLPSRSSGE